MIDGQQRDRYERGFRALLCRVRKRHVQTGVDRLLVESEQLASREQVTPAEALEIVFRHARQRIIRRLLRARCSASEGPRRRCEALLELSIPRAAPEDVPDFHCDAALGGLARWLRAAGYDAAFWPDIDDDHLLRTVQAQPAIMLTTDRLLMQRGVIVWGAMAARLVSIRLNKCEQFIDMVQRLSLPLRAPRCMSCGGALVAVDKEHVKARIPPRTYPWLDEFFACERCNRLFWKGTHWQRIKTVLDRARAISTSPAG
jgi:hypothetical protein